VAPGSGAVLVPAADRVGRLVELNGAMSARLRTDVPAANPDAPSSQAVMPPLAAPFSFSTWVLLPELPFVLSAAWNVSAQANLWCSQANDGNNVCLNVVTGTNASGVLALVWQASMRKDGVLLCATSSDGGGATVQAQVWTSLTITVDASFQMVLFVNSAPVPMSVGEFGSCVGGWNPTAPAPASGFNLLAGNRPLHALLAEASGWDVALSAADVSAGFTRDALPSSLQMVSISVLISPVLVFNVPSTPLALRPTLISGGGDLVLRLRSSEALIQPTTVRINSSAPFGSLQQDNQITLIPFALARTVTITFTIESGNGSAIVDNFYAAPDPLCIPVVQPYAPFAEALQSSADFAVNISGPSEHAHWSPDTPNTVLLFQPRSGDDGDYIDLMDVDDTLNSHIFPAVLPPSWSFALWISVDGPNSPETALMHVGVPGSLNDSIALIMDGLHGQVCVWFSTSSLPPPHTLTQLCVDYVHPSAMELFVVSLNVVGSEVWLRLHLNGLLRGSVSVPTAMPSIVRSFATIAHCGSAWAAVGRECRPAGGAMMGFHFFSRALLDTEVALLWLLRPRDVAPTPNPRIPVEHFLDGSNVTAWNSSAPPRFVPTTSGATPKTTCMLFTGNGSEVLDLLDPLDGGLQRSVWPVLDPVTTVGWTMDMWITFNLSVPSQHGALNESAGTLWTCGNGTEEVRLLQNTSTSGLRLEWWRSSSPEAPLVLEAASDAVTTQPSFSNVVASGELVHLRLSYHLMNAVTPQLLLFLNNAFVVALLLESANPTAPFVWPHVPSICRIGGPVASTVDPSSGPNGLRATLALVQVFPLLPYAPSLGDIMLYPPRQVLRYEPEWRMLAPLPNQGDTVTVGIDTTFSVSGPNFFCSSAAGDISVRHVQPSVDSHLPFDNPARFVDRSSFEVSLGAHLLPPPARPKLALVSNGVGQPLGGHHWRTASGFVELNVSASGDKDPAPALLSPSFSRDLFSGYYVSARDGDVFFSFAPTLAPGIRSSTLVVTVDGHVVFPNLVAQQGMAPIALQH
jgi:hypothetical protein